MTGFVRCRIGVHCVSSLVGAHFVLGRWKAMTSKLLASFSCNMWEGVMCMSGENFFSDGTVNSPSREIE